nr:hypothetical protein HAGR004_41190 [Bdellovibrio sp. HAGR004]
MIFFVFIILFFSTSVCLSWSHDFSIEGGGQVSYLTKTQRDDSFLVYNLIQRSNLGNKRCIGNLRLTSLHRKSEDVTLADGYVSLDRSYCQVKVNSISLTVGALSPEWTQTNGLNSANLFSSYDTRYSFFLDNKMQFYNPGIQLDYFSDHFTLRGYVGQMYNPYKVDTDQIPGLTKRHEQPEQLDMAAGIFMSFDSWDINLYWLNLKDRLGIFQLAQNSALIERVFYKNSSLGLSFSTTAHDWGVFRGDILHFLTRTIADDLLRTDSVSHSVLALNFESPTIWDTIFSLQYSTQHQGLEEKYFKSNNTEWMTNSIRTNVKDENVFQFDFAYNHFDNSKLYRGQYSWPNKRLTELTFGAEVYHPTADSYLYQGFKDLYRVYLKFDFKASL